MSTYSSNTSSINSSLAVYENNNTYGINNGTSILDYHLSFDAYHYSNNGWITVFNRDDSISITDGTSEINKFIRYISSYDRSRMESDDDDAENRSICTILDIKKLNDNWDGYGAKAIPKEAVNKAIRIVMDLRHQPDIYPTGRQSIQFEYELDDRSYLEFEIYADRITCMEVPQRKYDKAIFHQIENERIDTINRIVDGFYDAGKDNTK